LVVGIKIVTWFTSQTSIGERIWLYTPVQFVDFAGSFMHIEAFRTRNTSISCRIPDIALVHGISFALTSALFFVVAFKTLSAHIHISMISLTVLGRVFLTTFAIIIETIGARETTVIE
jgi:hypothetical protein